jgi:benzoate/toluate 1,2-dioxygenase beta subunit
MPPNDHTRRKIEQFIFREARLLDEGEFEAWLKLYEPRGIYWIPSQPGQIDPVNIASIIYEDHAILTMRVQRLLEARALVLTPMPRTTHVLGNIELLEERTNEFVVQAAFVCIEHQGDTQRIYSGRHTYHLWETTDAFRIGMKKVALANCDSTHAPMAIPL